MQRAGAIAALSCTLVATLDAAPVAVAQIDRTRIIALAGSVLKVESLKADGRLSIGTAVSVAPGRFVTNCHVTRDAELVVLVRGGVRWRVVSQRADLYLDLCMLSVSGLAAVPWVQLATARDLKVGDAVAAAGFTGGAGLQMHVGTVNALHELHGSKVIQSTTAFTSGASGGALFDAAGHLAGILTFRLRGRTTSTSRRRSTGSRRASTTTTTTYRSVRLQGRRRSGRNPSRRCRSSCRPRRCGATRSGSTCWR